jgi:hypothetical protein
MESIRMLMDDRGTIGAEDQVQVIIQVNQFEPYHRFFVNAAGHRNYSMRPGMNVIDPRHGGEWEQYLARPCHYRWSARASHRPDGWSLVVRLPFSSFGMKDRDRPPIRFNLARFSGYPDHVRGSVLIPPEDGAWVERHPAFCGWMVFDGK